MGGYPSPAYYKSEVVDLSGQNRTCPEIADFPLAYASIGSFFNGQVFVCGGHFGVNSSISKDQCFSYNKDENKWDEEARMNAERNHAFSLP